MAEHNRTGHRGENLAVQYIEEKGYQVLEKNWRYQKAEIDIIARHGDELIVIEVKTRTSKFFEQPKEAVTIKKQQLLVKATDAYLQQKEIELACRFDIISIVLDGTTVEIEHIKDAFYPLL